ncbi:vesicular glutamate transporter 2-like [Hetaerina americana]|uniref:vesicular glutamate transporter 2-like n=1 Tax=Hetaerina americana TaxID=62018 RepID=UPI003A7F14B1
MVCRGPATPKAALSVGEQVSTLQAPHETSVYHPFHHLAQAAAALGIAASLLAITQVGYHPNIIVFFLSLNGFISGAFFGGSYLNHLDLAVNYAGAISGILHTVSNSSGILVPIVVAAIVQNEQTTQKWSIVFYSGAFISAASYVLYFFFGSVEERPWNNMKKQNKET